MEVGIQPAGSSPNKYASAERHDSARILLVQSRVGFDYAMRRTRCLLSHWALLLTRSWIKGCRKEADKPSDEVSDWLRIPLSGIARLDLDRHIRYDHVRQQTQLRCSRFEWRLSAVLLSWTQTGTLGITTLDAVQPSRHQEVGRESYSPVTESEVVKKTEDSAAKLRSNQIREPEFTRPFNALSQSKNTKLP